MGAAGYSVCDIGSPKETGVYKVPYNLILFPTPFIKILIFLPQNVRPLPSSPFFFPNKINKLPSTPRAGTPVKTTKQYYKEPEAFLLLLAIQAGTLEAARELLAAIRKSVPMQQVLIATRGPLAAVRVANFFSSCMLLAPSSPGL